jgi:hypothetical protein
MSTEKKGTSFRLSDTARAILKEAKKKQGVSEASVLELALREYAEKHSIKTDS